MKKLLLTLVTLVAITQASDIVHYDTTDSGDKPISKPNYPSTEIYK